MMHQQSMMVGDMIPVHSEIPVHVEEMNNVNVAYENNASYAYDDLFPALPHSQPPVQRSIQQATNKLRVGSSLHTQVIYVYYNFVRIFFLYCHISYMILPYNISYWYKLLNII